jgi:PKD repeat protein
MAIARINGGMLQSNLERNGTSISIDATAYFDVQNYRLAVGQNFQAPQYTLDIAGNAHLGNLYILGNTITTEAGKKLNLGNVANINIAGGSNYYLLTTDGVGNLSFVDANTIPAISTIYTEVGGNLTGNTIALGTPTDLSLTANAAYDGWTTTTKVTDAIDNLNQIALNLGQGTFVGNVQFTANSVAGASPKTVIFTGTASGSPNTYYWDFGDGNTYTTGSSTITHTYNNILGGLYTVYYRASNSSGTWGGVAANGAIGSVDDFTRTSYITLYTPNPIPSFTANTVYLNTSNVLLFTDTSTYETDYTVYWGDGTTTIGSNIAPRTQKHTYTNSTGDTQYSIILQSNSTTAGPSNVSVNSAATSANVFSTHTPVITANVPWVINWESNGGGIVNFTNGTTTNPGNATVFGTGQRYNYWWSDGTANSNVQIGSGGATSGSYQNQTLTHIYTLSAAQQAASANVTYNTQLQVYNGHSTSPFAGSNVAVVVVPSVRSNIQATASTVSDKTGDTALNGYIYTDYNGNDRSLFTFRTAAQNTTTFNWGWGDGVASGNITTGSGTTSANITYSYTSTGAKTANLTVWGNPGISQSNSKSLTITINSNPAAPTALSGKTLSMSSSNQGSSPYLAANASDNTSGNIASAGTSVTRYTTTTPLVTSTITQANTSVVGTVTAYINRSNAGGVGFSTTSSGAQTNANLYVTGDADAHSAISAATYPTGFYKVFDAYVSSALTNFGLGYNDVHLEHTTAGKTGSIGFVKDDVTSVPTVVTTSVTVSNVAQAGVTIRTVSGIPYYQTGGNIRIAGLQAYNWIGQTYYNGTPLQIASNASAAEGTTGTLVSTQTKTYAQLDGATTFLSAGIPKANTGNIITNTYTFGNIFVNIDGTAAAVGNVNATLTSVNGSSTAVSLPTLLNVYSSAYTGFDETSIVSHAVGNLTVAKRIVLSSANVTTPVYANTGTNYYASAAFSSTSTVAGTTEAVVRWGNLRVNTTNYSSGYLPVGPDLSTGGDRTTTQSFKFALQRPILQNMKVVFTGRVAGMYIAAPGTKLTDTSNTLNGWLNANVAYAGSGFPGDNTAAGGNGSSGCAVGTAVPTSTFVSNVAYILTLGSAGTNQSYANQLLFNVVLGPNDWVSNIYLGNYS